VIRPHSPSRFTIAILLLVFLWPGAGVAHAQRRKVSRPKVQTSADKSFDPEKLPKLAVVVVGRTGQRVVGIQSKSDPGRLVEDQFVEILLQKGYNVVSRSDLQSVIKEQQFQRSGLTEDNAAELGKLLNVPAVMVLRITESTTESQRDQRTGTNVIIGRASLGARLVSVESGGILWTSNHTESGPVRARGQESLVLVDVAKNIAVAFPDRAPDKSSSGNGFDPDSLTKVAVLVLGNTRIRGVDTQNDQQRLVEDDFVQVLLDKGYSLATRSDMAAVVKEQQFQRSSLTESNATELGKLLNVPAVLVVKITEATVESQRSARTNGTALVGRASISARLINVESGLIQWTKTITDSHTLGSRGELSLLLERVAKTAAGAFPDKTSTSQSDAKPEKKKTTKSSSSSK
jgi:Curli production assembly/transport component CsgG